MLSIKLLWAPGIQVETGTAQVGLWGAVPPGQKYPLHRAVPHRVFRLREVLKVDGTNLARAAGLSVNHVRGLEDCSTVPSVETIEKIAAALAVDPGWLAFGWEGSEVWRERRPRDVVRPDDPEPDERLRVYRARHASLPQRLRESRMSKGLSLRRAAEAAGVSHQMWSNAENGRNAPKVDGLERMAVALGVPPAWLAYGEDPN